MDCADACRRAYPPWLRAARILLVVVAGFLCATAAPGLVIALIFLVVIYPGCLPVHG